MANEAQLVLKTEEPVDFIVIDTFGIEKGTCMELSGSSTIGRTAMSGSHFLAPFAGIARREKIAGDDRTRLALFRGGIFRMTCVGKDHVIDAGDAVMLSGSNLIASIKKSTLSGSAIVQGLKVGTALEDFAASETKEVWVGR